MNKEARKVAFVVRRIPHYREPFYERFILRNSHLNLKIFHGTPEKVSGGSGIVKNADFPFALKLRTFKVGSLIFQRGLLRHGLIQKYDVVVFEGSLRLVSSLLIMVGRKLLGKKNIIWLKGWPNEKEAIRKVKSLAKRIFLSLADAYVAYGYESLKSLRVFHIDEGRITVIQNTVDVTDLISKRYLHECSAIGNDALRGILTAQIPFLFNIGRIIPSKRVEDLILAFRKVAVGSIGNLHLIIAGDGPGLDELKRGVALEMPNIHILGKVSEVESKILFANCLFCVLPGAVGLSLNEAMAAGKAVICADEPGPDTELLIHKGNGLRFQKGDVDDLADCMRYLLSNGETRERLGKMARETISQKATLENMVNKFSSAVDSLLGQVR